MGYKNFPCRIVDDTGRDYTKAIIPDYSGEKSQYKAVVYVKGKGIPRIIKSSDIVSQDNSAIPMLCKVKIVKAEDSIRSFGFRGRKTDMIYENILKRNSFKSKGEKYEELYFVISSIDYNYKSEKDGSIRPCVSVKTPKNNIKFWLSDCEIIYPTLKGFNFPIDKTISPSNTVLYIKDNKQYLVKKVISNNTAKTISRNSMNSKLDVIQVSSLDSKKIIKDYCKYFKKITNVSTNTKKKSSIKAEEVSW